MGRSKEQAKLQNRSNLRQYNYDMKQSAARRADLERETDLTNQIQEATFEYQQEARNLERLSVLDQYEKNQDQYKQQIVWNEQALKAATDSQNRVFDERVGSLAEDYENQKTQMRRTNIDAQYNLDQTNFTLAQALYNADQNSKQTELKRNQAIFAANMDANRSRLNKRKAISAANLSIKQTKLDRNKSISDLNLTKDRNKLNYKNQQLSIGAERSDQTKALEQIQIERINIENKERDAIADRNFEQLAVDMQLIEAQGQELARGRSGKSSSYSMQSNLAAFAFNTAKISDALYRSKESLKLETKSVDSNRRALRRATRATNKRERLFDKGFELDKKQTKKDKKYTRKSAKLDIKGLEKDKKFTKKSSKLDIKQAKQDKSVARKSARLGFNQSRQSKKFAKRSAKLDLNKLSDELGLDIDIFEKNQSKLGQSLLNAAEQREFAMSEIARGKVQADLQTDAARMLPPRFAPDPPRPYKAEMPSLVPPPEPVQVAREAFQVPQPKAQSGFSKVLSIGAGILGIAGAAFTGGASLGLTGGLFGAGAAATGTALGAASSGLGLISKYT